MRDRLESDRRRAGIKGHTEMGSPAGGDRLELIAHSQLPILISNSGKVSLPVELGLGLLDLCRRAGVGRTPSK